MTLHLAEVVIVGGGCYGSFYLQQLLRARERGALDWQTVRVVDQAADCAVATAIPEAADVVLEQAEWQEFFSRWLDSDRRSVDDRIVPSPLMPHLFADWLAAVAARRWPDHRVERLAVDEPVGTPFDMRHPHDGNRYVSHADWLCPVHCIEPARCPMIAAPRSWEMADTVRRWAAATGRSAAVFVCRHVSHGVGMIDAQPILDARVAMDQEIARHGRAEWAVGSVSSCHGALGLIRIAPADRAARELAIEPRV